MLRSRAAPRGLRLERLEDHAGCCLLLGPVLLVLLARGLCGGSPILLLSRVRHSEQCSLFHDLPGAKEGSVSLAFSSLNPCFLCRGITADTVISACRPVAQLLFSSTSCYGRSGLLITSYCFITIKAELAHDISFRCTTQGADICVLYNVPTTLGLYPRVPVQTDHTVIDCVPLPLLHPALPPHPSGTVSSFLVSESLLSFRFICLDF